MNESLILKRGIVKKKLNINQYELEDKNGVKLIMTIPKKFLMNYIKIEIGDIGYILVSSEEEVEGKWVIKYDFMENADLYEQKQILDAEAKKGTFG